MNTVQLIGRLTRDIELKFTSSGLAVGSFNLAVNRNFTNQQGEREADFINCVVWRKTAENLANFTRKGSQVGIEGRIQTRNYENQQRQKVYVTEVVVDQFHLLDKKPDDADNSQNQGNNNGFSGQNYNQGNNQGNNYNSGNQQNNGGFNMQDGTPVDIIESDLPF